MKLSVLTALGLVLMASSVSAQGRVGQNQPPNQWVMNCNTERGRDCTVSAMIDGGPDNLLGTAAASLIRLLVSVPRNLGMTRALYSTAFFDPQAADEDSVEEIARRHADPRMKVAAKRAFVRHFDFCKRLGPFHERLADLQAPTLVVWGSDDRLFRASDAEVAKRVLRNVRTEMIERCGHCPQIEQPERFTEVVLEFLAAK